MSATRNEITTKTLFDNQENDDKTPATAIGGGLFEVVGPSSSKAATAAAHNNVHSAMGRIPKKTTAGQSGVDRVSIVDRPEDKEREEQRRKKNTGMRKSQYGRDAGRCFNCGGKGHFARHCQKKRNSNNPKRKRGDSGSESEEESSTQREMKRMARIITRGAQHFDAVEAAKNLLSGAAKK